GYSKILMEDFGPRLEPEAQRLLGVIREATGQMSQLIDALLRFARLGRGGMRRSVTDLSALVKQEVAKSEPEKKNRQVEWRVGATFFFTLDDDEPAPATLPANHFVATGEAS